VGIDLDWPWSERGKIGDQDHTKLLIGPCPSALLFPCVLDFVTG
jgi:hypothetical protein